MSDKKATSPIANPTTTNAILQSHGLVAKKNFGQNFLINDAIIKKICDLADIQPGDAVVEIGPGLGVLTLALLSKGAQVLAIEKDEDMVCILDENVKEYCPDKLRNLKIINEDALRPDADQFYKFAGETSLKLVSNLPYNIAAPLIITYFQQIQQLESATVMVQKEIADRILAAPGNKNYGAYTVKLSFYALANGKFKVSPNNFIPAPRVDSAVIRLEKKQNIDFKLASNACEIADAAFAHRRKTIKNSIKDFYANNPTQAQKAYAAFANAGVSTSLRAETLDSKTFLQIAQLVK